MSLIPLPSQPTDTPWPTIDWPTADLPGSLDRVRFEPLIAEAFDSVSSDRLGKTHALLVVKGGRIIFERYGEGFGPESTQPSWSKAKSMTHALVGMLVGDGQLDIHAPVAVPEWRDPGDPRGKITLDHLLRMSSGLKFVEDYVPGHVSDVREMLFFSGKDDVAAYAASQPPIHPPGTVWSYASGTTNIVARLAASAAGGEFRQFMQDRLFGPLGMRSPIPKFDAAGTFIGSSYCFCTPRDFARFGLLYLRDGVWDGARLLPEGWVDYARTPTPQPVEAVEGAYGAHWWLGVGGPGSFSANGYAGQYTVLVPDLDLILVRNGDTPLENKDELKAWVGAVIDAFR